MAEYFNPALRAFVEQLGKETIVAQVLVRQAGASFELRHIADRAADRTSLQGISLADLRQRVTFTASGAYRPLKSAPNLPSGWRLDAHDDSQLESAINTVYPGAIADWFATQSGTPPVTNFREFTARQTGMYRITHMLNDEQAALAIRAGCDRAFCLKRRLWSSPGWPTDSAEDKSIIPCLEPCAVLLEFSRKTMRLEQEEKTGLSLGEGDLETLRQSVTELLRQHSEVIREADFDSPINPRRLQRLLLKLS
jgi:hypothetical protein